MINADGGLRQQKIWYAIFLETQQKVLRKLEILCNQVGVEKAIEEMDKIYDNWRDGKTKVIIDKYLKMEYNKNMNTEKNNDWIDFWDMFFGFDEKANSKQQNQEKPIKQEKPKTNELIELPSKQQIFRWIRVTKSYEKLNLSPKNLEKFFEFSSSRVILTAISTVIEVSIFDLVDGIKGVKFEQKKKTFQFKNSFSHNIKVGHTVNVAGIGIGRVARIPEDRNSYVLVYIKSDFDRAKTFIKENAQREIKSDERALKNFGNYIFRDLVAVNRRYIQRVDKNWTRGVSK